VAVGNRLLVRHAVAVDQHGATVLVLDRDDVPAPMAADRFDGFAAVPLPPVDVIGAAGRLWVAERALSEGALRARWSGAAVREAAARTAAASLGARRAAALDLITLGRPDNPALDLSTAELTWYRARAAAGAGDVLALLTLLRDLPPTGYPGRVDLLLLRAADLFADPALAEEAGALLEPFVETSVDARALRAALRPPAALGPDVARDALDLLPTYAPLAAGDDAQVAAITWAITGDGPLPGGARSSGPAMRALDTGLTLLAACRDDPGGLDEDSLRAVGFVAELARRAYLAGDERGLAELPDDESVRHYRALHAYRTTGRLDLDALRPDAQATAKRTDELSRTFSGRRMATAEIAADPSTWPFLRANAVDEKITLTDRLGGAYPEFAQWLALCATSSSLRDARWAEVAATGQRIADQAKSPVLAAEALNVVAYAKWQLGSSVEALALLDRALATHPAEAYAVNAALIAADDGVRVALPYLARVVDLATSPRVRQGAVTHAITLWLTRDGGVDYPATLATLVRGALTARQDDDEFHRTLLELSLANDRVWLSRADVVAHGPLQTRTARYLVARARYAEDRTGDALRDAARAIVALRRHKPRPAWVEPELTRLAEEVDLALRTPDHAVNPAPAVAVLLAADVLDLPARLTLAIRAGALLARSAERRGRLVSVDAERRLILQPVEQYAGRRDELGADGAHTVAAVLAEHLRVAVTAIVNVVVARSGALVDHWQRLDRAPATEPRVVERKVEILDRLDRYLDRCRPYLTAMAGLPVDEEFQHRVHDIVTRLAAISARARGSLA
jgi:hypothetical protein